MAIFGQKYPAEGRELPFFKPKGAEEKKKSPISKIGWPYGLGGVHQRRKGLIKK